MVEYDEMDFDDEEPSNIIEHDDELNDESFIDYMMNNNLLKDDWDLNIYSNDYSHNMDKKIILEVIKKCRSLITALKQSSILSGYFDRIRLDMGIKRGLPMDCETRWNSTSYLINSFINCKNLIITFFGAKNTFDISRSLVQRLAAIELHIDDWELLSNLQKVLVPFALAIKFLSGTTYPTAGLCYYSIQKLKFFLHYINEDTPTIKALKHMLLIQFEKYFYSDQQQLMLLKVSENIEFLSLYIVKILAN
jgi:hypothetical protein